MTDFSPTLPDKPNRLALPVLNDVSPRREDQAAKKPVKATVMDAEQFVSNLRNVLDQAEFSVRPAQDDSGFCDTEFERNRNIWAMGKIRTRLDAVRTLLSSQGRFKIRISTTTIPIRFTAGLGQYRFRTVVVQQIDGQHGALKWVEPANWFSALGQPMACYSQPDPAKVNDSDSETSRTSVQLNDQPGILKQAKALVKEINRL